MAPPAPSRTVRALLVGGTAVALLLAVRGPNAGATVAIIVAVGLAAVVSSMVGFAHSAIAGVVVYRLADGPVEAITILMACSLAIQAYAVLHLRRAIDWRRVAPFVAGGLVTLVPGCWLALHAPVRAWLAGLGVFLAAYGLLMLWRRPGPAPAPGRPGRLGDLLAGALGGFTGPLAAFPSLPVTLWLGWQGLDKTRQRAIYQPYIVVMQLAALSALAVMGDGRPLRLAQLSFAVPSLLGCSIGLRLFHRLSTAHFNTMVHLLVAVSGAALALK